jgi:uncharacterized protein involved in response to NO
MQGDRAMQGTARFALWDLGFRPFYLLASLFSAASVLLWVLQYSGHLEGTYLRGAVWHGHEMLFGYALAVIAGFLLTAVRNWTGQPTPTGLPLMLLALLWLCGRVLVLTPFGVAAAWVNAAFPIGVAVAIGRPLLLARNRRNYFFIGLLMLLSGLILAVHLSWQQHLGIAPQAGLQAGLDVVLFIMAVMGGRVIPMFTNNGVPGANATRRAWVEKAALGSVLLLFAADALRMPAAVLMPILVFATLAHGARLALWHSWRTRATPLVWILHAAYAWIVLHLLLRAGAAGALVPAPLATHALTLGAIGGLTLGMMTRTARGHTGRPLAADRFDLAMFVLVQAAAVTRVCGGWLSGAGYVPSVQASGVLWAAAFGLYAVRYWPVLTRPRLDGKPG